MRLLVIDNEGDVRELLRWRVRYGGRRVIAAGARFHGSEIDCGLAGMDVRGVFWLVLPALGTE